MFPNIIYRINFKEPHKDNNKKLNSKLFLHNSKLIYIFVVVLMVNKFFAPLKKRLSRLNNEFLFIWLVL